jgi:NTE family protein
MKKVGIALSGGGMTAIVHLGVLKALQEFDIYPEVISGTSMGSIIASVYASGMSINNIIKQFNSIDKHLLDLDISGILSSIFTGHVPIGIYKGNKIEAFVDNMVRGMQIKEIDKKIAVVATNLNGGENVIFTNSYDIQPSSERIIINNVAMSKAVRASMSFPFAFTPVKMNDMILVDGGLVANCPANLCQEMGAEIVFISSIMDYKKKKIANDHALTISDQLINILLKEASEDDTDFLNTKTVNIPLTGLQEVPLLAITKENITKGIILGYDNTCNLLSTMDLTFLQN